MKLSQTPTFARAIKKLHPNQKRALDKALRLLSESPTKGDPKVGDLAGVYIFKFKVENLEWLIAYRLVTKSQLKLLTVGPHENFYRDLKRTSFS